MNMNMTTDTNAANSTARRRRALFGAGAAAVALVGWAAFRPELLFIDKKVNEALPAASAAMLPVTLSEGGFKGLAHQTTGKAGVYRLADGRQVLRLSGFKTSKGPDVRVYLVEGDNGADNAAINAGHYLSLGELKGNEGDQNYELPAGVELSKYRSVSIWCARFAVNFGAATLAGSASHMSQTAPVQAAVTMMTPASYTTMASEADLTVTTGNFRRVTHNTNGTVTILEHEDGARELRLTGFKTEMGPALHVYLVAAGDARDNSSVTKSGFIDLGKLKKITGEQSYKVPAKIDLWKYRAVTIWCNKFKVNFGTAPLAAKQS